MTELKSTTNFRLGLTGSIGMGKTTVTNIFRKNNIPVWSADSVVHKLYKSNASGTLEIQSFLPEVVSDEGVCREKLSELIIKKPILIKKIEEKIFPLIRLNRENFIEQHREKSLLLFDIPLLYETKAYLWLDSVLVVTAPKKVQEKRVMDRKGMSKEKLDFLLSKQISDKEKRKKADYVINTNVTLKMLNRTVEQFIKDLVSKG